MSRARRPTRRGVVALALAASALTAACDGAGLDLPATDVSTTDAPATGDLADLGDSSDAPDPADVPTTSHSDTSADADIAPDTADVGDAPDTVDIDSSDSDIADTVEPPPEGPPLYPATERHSPLTPRLVERMRTIADAHPRNERVFMKVGDSITVSTSFLHCFAGGGVELDGRDHLAPSVAWFDAVEIAPGETSWNRQSLAAVVGWPAHRVLEGELTSEMNATDARFATLMYGTNDIGWENPELFANSMLDIVDQLLGAGVIPVMSSIPPRDDSPSADAAVPRYNAIVRAIARARGVPFVDYHRELLALPDHGLAGDGVHPRSYAGGACVLTAQGLTAGYNVRNLLVLEAFDRLRRVVVDGEPAPDAPAAPLDGDGSATAPWHLTGAMLPFGDIRDTAVEGTAQVPAYGCQPGTDEGGNELWYRLDLDQPTRLGLAVHDRGDVDIDVHLLDASGDPTAGCLQRDHREIVADLSAGTYYVVLDTWVSAAEGPRSGEVLFVAWTE